MDKKRSNSFIQKGGAKSAEVKWGRNSQGCDWKGEKLIWQLFLLALLMFPLRTKHPLHPLSHLGSPNSLTPRHPAISPPTRPTSTSNPKHTHTTATLPKPWFASLNTYKLCFYFSLPLLLWVFPPSSHHRLTTPSHTPREKAPSITAVHSDPRRNLFSLGNILLWNTLAQVCFLLGHEEEGGWGFLRWRQCGTWAKWRPCWCIFTACQSEVCWCVGALCYSSGEAEGSCGAATEVAAVGNGVGVLVGVCVCMWRVCVAQDRTTWCPCSPHSPHAGSVPSTAECCRGAGLG